MAVLDNVHREKLSPERELAVCRAMMELSGDIAFEWDLISDTVCLSEKYTRRFGRPAVHQLFSRNVASLPNFHPDDLSELVEEVDRMRRGAAYGESVIRILDRRGVYTWNRIRAAAEFDAEGSLVKIIGTIADVDYDKRRSQELLNKAEHDSLTGLLNKDTARIRAEQYLANMEEGQCAAMLIIDLDNFKAVNDQYGHLFGDTVLSHVGTTIRGLFRESDILARIGGDEFMVIMRDIPDQTLAEHRCIRLTQTMQHLYGRQLQQCQFSCSVGVAMIPEHGTSYQKLFQRADKALYQAKDLGKNTYAIFSHGADSKRHETRAKPRLQSDSGLVSAWGDAALHMLEQLYETQDVSASFSSVMGMVGVQLRAEHIFLVSTAETRPVLEWRDRCISGDADTFAAGAAQPWNRALELLNDEGLFYCHDAQHAPADNAEVLELFGARALLLCAVRDNDRVYGYAGMRSAEEIRLWTQKEIDALGFLGRLALMFFWGNRDK